MTMGRAERLGDAVGFRMRWESTAPGTRSARIRWSTGKEVLYAIKDYGGAFVPLLALIGPNEDVRSISFLTSWGEPVPEGDPRARAFPSEKAAQAAVRKNLAVQDGFGRAPAMDDTQPIPALSTRPPWVVVRDGRDGVRVVARAHSEASARDAAMKALLRDRDGRVEYHVHHVRNAPWADSLGGPALNAAPVVGPVFDPLAWTTIRYRGGTALEARFTSARGYSIWMPRRRGTVEVYRHDRNRRGHWGLRPLRVVPGTQSRSLDYGSIRSALVEVRDDWTGARRRDWIGGRSLAPIVSALRKLLADPRRTFSVQSMRPFYGLRDHSDRDIRAALKAMTETGLVLSYPWMPRGYYSGTTRLANAMLKEAR